MGIALGGNAACGDDGGAQDSGVDSGPVCGNGVVEEGELCDDGNDDNTDGCCNTCLPCPVCDTEIWQECAPGLSRCCRSPEDVPTECVVDPENPERGRCLLACDTASDCYWSNRCGERFPGHCWSAYCGPEEDGAEMNGACAVNGLQGYCYPQSTAEASWGICLEPGSLPTGADCIRGFPLDRIPRDVETCQEGICTDWTGGQSPRCLDVCDPVAAYDATAVVGGPGACPLGYNCLSYSYLTSYSGKRMADRGICVPSPSTDPDGYLSCDLLTGELIADRGIFCSDAAPGTRCGLFRTGSLMGVCTTADASPLDLGAACSPDATSLECPPGSLCWLADPFGTGDATDHACLQACDAADPGFVCDASDLLCTSLSHGVEDDSPTRLGLCAPPPVD